MTMESDLQTLLAGICPRTFPDVAPSGTVAPWVVWQGLGGASLRFVDNTAGDKRFTLTQVSVFSKKRIDSLNLSRQIEDVLCASSLFIASPQGEPMSTFESDTSLYGCIQRFVIVSSR